MCLSAEPGGITVSERNDKDMEMEGLPNMKQIQPAVWNLPGIWAITSEGHQNDFFSPAGADAGVCPQSSTG